MRLLYWLRQVRSLDELGELTELVLCQVDLEFLPKHHIDIAPTQALFLDLPPFKASEQAYS